MRKCPLVPLCLSLSVMVASVASAATLKIPVGAPLYSMELPAGWTTDETNGGLLCHSANTEVTMFLEATTAKSVGELIRGAVDWLWEEDFRLDLSTQRETKFTAAGMAWTQLSWVGRNEDSEQADISFLFGDLGKNKVAAITYWTTARAGAKDKAAIERMFGSFRQVLK
jgi:hypothetical protein